jgi:methylmalonyl-CoA/ethylmalonyl-CoA epimerase
LNQNAETLSVKRIDHVGVLVANANAALDTFTKDFGFVANGDWIEPDGSFRLVYLDAGDTTLQLVEPLAPGPLMDDLDARGEGLHHVCFLVDDLDAALTSFERDINSEPYIGGRGSRVCFLAKRRIGVLVELTEP